MVGNKVLRWFLAQYDPSKASAGDISHARDGHCPWSMDRGPVLSLGGPEKGRVLNFWSYFLKLFFFA